MCFIHSPQDGASSYEGQEVLFFRGQKPLSYSEKNNFSRPCHSHRSRFQSQKGKYQLFVGENRYESTWKRTWKKSQSRLANAWKKLQEFWQQFIQDTFSMNTPRKILSGLPKTPKKQLCNFWNGAMHKISWLSNVNKKLRNVNKSDFLHHPSRTDEIVAVSGQISPLLSFNLCLLAAWDYIIWRCQENSQWVMIEVKTEKRNTFVNRCFWWNFAKFKWEFLHLC